MTFELNGITRQTTIADKTVAPQGKARAKADANDPKQIGASIPGMITSLAVSVGSKVQKGDKLLTLEAMKMHTTVNSPADGVVQEVAVAIGDTVESKDLLVRLG